MHKVPEQHCSLGRKPDLSSPKSFKQYSLGIFQSATFKQRLNTQVTYFMNDYLKGQIKSNFWIVMQLGYASYNAKFFYGHLQFAVLPTKMYIFQHLLLHSP